MSRRSWQVGHSTCTWYRGCATTVVGIETPAPEAASTSTCRAGASLTRSEPLPLNESPMVPFGTGADGWGSSTASVVPPHMQVPIAADHSREHRGHLYLRCGAACTVTYPS